MYTTTKMFAMYFGDRQKKDYTMHSQTTRKSNADQKNTTPKVRTKLLLFHGTKGVQSKK